MVTYPVSDMYRNYSWFDVENVRRAFNNSTGDHWSRYLVCNCLVAFTSQFVQDDDASWQPLMNSKCCYAAFQKQNVCLWVFLGIHDVIHRRHTNIDVIDDKLDTLGTWKTKCPSENCITNTELGIFGADTFQKFWVRKWNWKLVLLINTKLPETSDYVHSVVTKRRVVWWIITDSAKERIAVIPMCQVVQQQRRKKIGFSETSGTTQKTGSSITPLWDIMVRITQNTGSAHGP